MLLCLVLLAADPPPAYGMLTQPAQRVACTLTIKIDAPELRTNEWVLLAARPPELPGQTNIVAGLSPLGKVVKDLSELKRPAFLARAPVTNSAQRQSQEVKLTAQATLHSRVLVEGEAAKKLAPAPPLSPEARRLALGTNTIVDHEDARFRAWLDAQELRRRDGENDVEFGKRLFLHLRERCEYEYKKSMDRSVSSVCKACKSDCGGLSALFVAALRANGVPARVLIGRWATSSRSNAKLEGLDYYQTHVKAEFFAEGVGWIPVDLALAISERGKEAPPLRCFGRDPGDFLVFHVDHDMKLDSVHFGVKTIDGLQGVAYYAPGPGTFAGASTVEKWEVRRQPPAAAGARR